MPRKNVLAFIVLALLLLSFAVPLNLVVGKSIRVYSFDIALAFAYGTWLLEMFRESRLRLTTDAVFDLVVKALIAWCVVSLLAQGQMRTSLNGILFYLRLYLIFLYVRSHLQSFRDYRVAVTMILVLLALEGAVSIAQYATKTNVGSLPDLVGDKVQRLRFATADEVPGVGILFRARGTLGYDTNLAHWFELLLPLPASLWLMTKKRRNEYAYALLVALGYAGLVFTFSRGAWMGLAVAMGVLFVLTWKREGFDRGRLMRAARIAGVMVALTWVLALPIKLRLLGPAENSVQVRGKLNNMALSMMKKKPLTGIGLGNYAKEAEKSEGAEKGFAKQRAEIKAHNLYLAMASETGLVGLAIFLAFLGITGSRFFQVHNHAARWEAAVGRALFAGLCGILVHGLVAWGVLSYMVFPLFWFLLALGSALGSRPGAVTHGA